MSSTIEKIKDCLNIVDVVSQYIKLEKAGNNLKAKCPFHNEKTPSFFVSPIRNSYYCFGCNASGDIFSFVENFEGVDFMGVDGKGKLSKFIERVMDFSVKQKIISKKFDLSDFLNPAFIIEYYNNN